MAVTVRGKAKIEWKPNYTLTFTSTDGLSLDPGTTLHQLVATLTNTSTGAAIPDRQIKLTTNPTGRVGHRIRGTTDANGVVTFQVSNMSVESVVYTASLIPVPAITDPTVTATLTIQWGGVVCSQCNNDIQVGEVEIFQPNEVPESFGYLITWTVHTTSGPTCETITDVTHAQGFYYTFEGSEGGTPDPNNYDVADIVVEATGAFTQEFVDEQTPILEAQRDAAAIPIQANQC